MMGWMNMMKKLLVFVLAASFALAGCAAVQGSDSGGKSTSQSAQTTTAATASEDVQNGADLEVGIYEINQYGNIMLDVESDSMKELGYEPGDIIGVKIGDSEMEMPIGTNYSDVDAKSPICCFKTASGGEHVIILAMNDGNLAETMGIAECRAIDEDPGYEWTFADGLDKSVAVRISMANKCGYVEEYASRQVENARTNNREDYADLSDAEYANFRVVETTGMGAGTLYRSSSPVNPQLNRNEQADEALLLAHVQTVMNMADSESEMSQYEGYYQTNYSGCDIIALDMTTDVMQESFGENLAEGFRFIASHDGPYLIHCTEGKDRTGFAVAVLECLMGASADEVEQDYMLSFVNYYRMEPGAAAYEHIATSNIETSLAGAFGVASIRDESVDLQACAEAYLSEIGMSGDEISLLKDRLAKEYGGA